MPELPEVEIVRRVLESKIKGKTIIELEICRPETFQGDPKKVVGEKMVNFSRVGKQLSVELSNGLFLLFHLKMTGQLIYQGQERQVMGHPTKDMYSETLPSKSTRVYFTFSDNSRLYFNDQRKFGWIRLFTKGELEEFQKNLGVDVISPDFTLNYFTSRLNSSRPIKIILLDQDRFAGIGNIYANDALFEAGISPLRPADSLTPAETKKLHKSVVDIILESITHGGSTAKDQKYVLPDGSKGSHQFHFRVYQREGEPCPGNCSGTVKRITLGGRGTFYCPECQK